MIDIVYPIGKKSYWNDREIIFSLRSVEKHLSNVGKVWIVGRVPEGVTNIHHIPAQDTYPVPDTNIMHKVLKACEHPEVSDPFLFFNDDHYILKDFDTTQFPNFYEGTLQEYVHRRGTDGYGQRARNTLALLEAKGLPTKYFDVHFPILYSKQGFIDHVVRNIQHENEKHGYILKSLYGNGMQLEGTDVKDCKSAIAPSERAVCFSTTPRVSAAVHQFLKFKFNDPSRYEK